jgi:hypothetical protein
MQTTEKTCFKCLCKLPLEAFYKHAAMGDGRLGKCKECTKKDAEWRRASLWSEHIERNSLLASKQIMLFELRCVMVDWISGRARYAAQKNRLATTLITTGHSMLFGFARRTTSRPMQWFRTH